MSSLSLCSCVGFVRYFPLSVKDTSRCWPSLWPHNTIAVQSLQASWSTYSVCLSPLFTFTFLFFFFFPVKQKQLFPPHSLNNALCGQCEVTTTNKGRSAKKWAKHSSLFRAPSLPVAPRLPSGAPPMHPPSEVQHATAYKGRIGD